MKAEETAERFRPYMRFRLKQWIQDERILSGAVETSTDLLRLAVQSDRISQGKLRAFKERKKQRRERGT